MTLREPESYHAHKNHNRDRFLLSNVGKSSSSILGAADIIAETSSGNNLRK